MKKTKYSQKNAKKLTEIRLFVLLQKKKYYNMITLSYTKEIM